MNTELDRKTVRYPLICFIICFAAYMTIYISRINLSMASAELIDKGFMTAGQIGILGSVFSIVYACSRLFNSALGDRAYPWIMVCSGLLIAGLANFLSGFSVTTSFILTAILWGINAYGQSMLWGSLLRTVSAIYEPRRAKKFSALLGTSVASGNLLAIIISTMLINRFGVEYAYFVPGLINIIFAPIVFFAIHKVPFEGKKENTNVFSSFKLFIDPRIRTMIVPVFFHGVIKDNVNLWMASYFIVAHNKDLKQSAYFVLLIPFVGMVGRLLYNVIYNIFGKNEFVVLMAGFIACTILAVLLIVPLPALLTAICLSLIYAMTSIINTSFLAVYPMKFAEDGDTAAVSGIMDFMSYLGHGIGSAVFGFIIDKFTAGGNELGGYKMMFAIWAVIAVISLVIVTVEKKKAKA